MRILIGNRELSTEIDNLYTLTAIQAVQLDRVREVRSIINRLITHSGGAVATDSTTLAKSIVNKLNDALGDTDE